MLKHRQRPDSQVALVADNVISFVVHGVAKPAGSKRAFVVRRRDGSVGASVTDDCKASKGWKQQVAWAARQAYDGPLLEGPLEVSFTFHVVRPKGHYRSGRNSDQLKPSAPRYPTTRPDVLKLARGIEDALSGVVYRDDSQIFVERLLKRYGETAKVEIQIVLRDHERT